MTRRKDKTADACYETLVTLGLNPEEWRVYVDVGKSFGYNPQNNRSYVGVRIEHLSTGRVYETGEKGVFTKAQARQDAQRQIRELLRNAKA